MELNSGVQAVHKRKHKKKATIYYVGNRLTIRLLQALKNRRDTPGSRN